MKLMSTRTVVLATFFLALSFAAQSQSNYDFKNPQLISGLPLTTGAVYRFNNVKPGIDARVTISAITGGILLTDIDGSGGFQRALQPVLSVPGKKNGYVELTIRFYNHNTTTLKTQSEVAITPIDVDGQTYGNLKLYEFDQIEEPNGYTYFQNAGSELNMSYSGNWVQGKNTGAVDYAGIDTMQKSVMFTTVNANINTIRVRVGCDNQSNTLASRLRSLYFQRFTYPFELVLPNRTLIKFSGAQKDKKVELKGILSASHTFDKIMIERSSNGNSFGFLAELPITNGGTAEFPFTYVDQNPLEGTNYYRVRLLNTHQALQEISNTLMVKTQTSESNDLEIFNSIVKKGDPSITLQSKVDSEMMIELVDMMGRLVYNKKTRINKGVNLIDLANFNPGTGYLVLVARTGESTIKHKMIIQ